MKKIQEKYFSKTLALCTGRTAPWHHLVHSQNAHKGKTHTTPESCNWGKRELEFTECFPHAGTFVGPFIHISAPPSTVWPSTSGAH